MMNYISFIQRSWPFVAALFFGVYSLQTVNATDNGVCAQTQLHLEQRTVITRAAFRATLEMSNNMAAELESMSVTLNIKDANGQDAKAAFGVPIPILTGFTAIDGTGILAGNSAGKVEWTIIPTRDAAPISATAYSISGQISYVKDGVQLTIPLYPATITVLPEASLKVKYFVERDVYSDDPFTPEVEPAVPFALGLIVTNAGMGSAKDFTITSSQPTIVDNEKGLLVAFQLIGTQVGSQQLAPSLTANLGTIAPGGSAVALWRMTSTVQGEFIDYKASFKHVDDLGNERLSLVDSVEIHETNHVVRIDTPFDDGLPDFLTNDQPNDAHLPDTLYSSDGSVFPVTTVTTATVTGSPTAGTGEVKVTASLPSGWAYLQIADPSDGQLQLLKVLRSDGREIRLGDNAWTTLRTLHPTDQPAQRESYLHILDFNSTGSYTLTFADAALSSRIEPLSANSPNTFQVSWSGTGGIDGVATYTVYVSDDGGVTWIPWLSNTTATSATYSGQPGQTYRFYSVATDHAGNAQTVDIANAAVGTQALTHINFWRWLHFNITTNSGVAADNANPTNDGYVNLLKYATGLDPNVVRTVPLMATHMGSNVLTVTFPRDTAAYDVTITLQATDSLTGQWNTLGQSALGAQFSSSVSGVSSVETGVGGVRNVTVLDSRFKNTTKPAQFYRLLISY